MKGSSEKFHMGIATMSRLTKRAYLRLCPEKRRKKNLTGNGLNEGKHARYSEMRVSWLTSIPSFEVWLELAHIKHHCIACKHYDIRILNIFL